MTKAEGDDSGDDENDGAPAASYNASVDWDSWTPGAPGVAAKVAGPGLSTLLDQAGISIKGMNETTLDRLANVLAQGINAGDSVQSIARDLGDIVSDSSRAFMIADTEVARAMTQGSLDFYASAGIEKFNVIGEPDACEEICVPEIGDNPHSLDDETVPYHPRCRCAVSPVVETGAQTTDTEDEG